jgi:hypothetical protein
MLLYIIFIYVVVIPLLVYLAILTIRALNKIGYSLSKPYGQKEYLRSLENQNFDRAWDKE